MKENVEELFKCLVELENMEKVNDLSLNLKNDYNSIFKEAKDLKIVVLDLKEHEIIQELFLELDKFNCEKYNSLLLYAQRENEVLIAKRKDENLLTKVVKCVIIIVADPDHEKIEKLFK